MPTARIGEISLYYEVHGTGLNLVLIEGLAYHTWMWYRQLPAFSRHFRTLIYDNRGVGQSDMPAGPYTHAQNAADLRGLLDHLGWDRTHVLGISMGGFIAQAFTLANPDRVDRLVLAETGFGGPNMVPVPAAAVAVLLPPPGTSIEQRMRLGAPVVYGDPAWPDRHPDEFAQIVRWREEHPQPPEAALAQAMAAVTFNVEKRLSEISAPTLVITGDRDGVVPPRNAGLLAARIPGALLDVIPGASHHMFYEHAERFNEDVITFLQSQRPAGAVAGGAPGR